MEDAELATEGTHTTSKNEQYPFKLFGIFDGHCNDNDRPAGAEVSKFVTVKMLSTLSEQLNVNCSDNLTDDGIFTAYKSLVFLEASSDLKFLGPVNSSLS